MIECDRPQGFCNRNVACAQNMTCLHTKPTEMVGPGKIVCKGIAPERRCETTSLCNEWGACLFLKDKIDAATTDFNVKSSPTKPMLSLIPREALEAMARGLRYGAFDRKPTPYGKNNWMAGAEWSRYYDALQRHLIAWNDCEDIDAESALHHLDLAMADLAILRTYVAKSLGKDDRKS